MNLFVIAIMEFAVKAIRIGGVRAMANKTTITPISVINDNYAQKQNGRSASYGLKRRENQQAR